MANEPLPQAEAALADLAEPFERWRQTRATVQERIPSSLWDQAVALATVLPGSQVGHQLQILAVEGPLAGAYLMGGAGGVIGLMPLRHFPQLKQGRLNPPFQRQHRLRRQRQAHCQWE